METQGCKAPQKTDPTFLGRVELPPKKRKSVYNEPPDRDNLKTDSNSNEQPKITLGVAEPAQNIDPQNQPNNGFDQDPQKADPNTETQLGNDDHESSFNTYLDLNKESEEESPTPSSFTLSLASPQNQQNNGFDQDPQKAYPNTETPLGNDDHESSFNTYLDLNKKSEEELSTPSSFTLRLASPPSKCPILVCKFCGKHFLTKQALGGHQNAHKKEREIQKVRKEAQELRAKSFLYSLPGATSNPFPEKYVGHRHQYLPYNGYEKSASQAMPLGASFDSGWPSPFPTSLGPKISMIVI